MSAGTKVGKAESRLVRQWQGLSRHRPLSSFNQRDLEAGAKVELEHVHHLGLARRIAADHLTEDPNYYRKLKKMERGRSCGTGLSSGETCEPAKFKAWKEREIKRLAFQTVKDAFAGVRVIKEIVGVDLTVREHVVFVGINQQGRIMAVSDGTSTEKSVCRYHVADALLALFQSATRPEEVKGVLIGHNHPSGDASPSDDDIKTTKGLTCRIGSLLAVVDHIIVSTGEDRYGNRIKEFRSEYSFRESNPGALVVPRC